MFFLFATESPFMEAIRTGKSITPFLHEISERRRCKRRRLNTPIDEALRAASQYNKVSIVNQLLALQGDLAPSTEGIKLAFLDASINGHVNVSRQFLKTDKIDPNTFNIALMYATFYERLGCVTLLLESQHKEIVMDYTLGFCLIRASIIGHLKIVKLLVETHRISKEMMIRAREEASRRSGGEHLKIFRLLEK